MDSASVPPRCTHHLSIYPPHLYPAPPPPSRHVPSPSRRRAINHHIPMLYGNGRKNPAFNVILPSLSSTSRSVSVHPSCVQSGPTDKSYPPQVVKCVRAGFCHLSGTFAGINIDSVKTSRPNGGRLHEAEVWDLPPVPTGLRLFWLLPDWLKRSFRDRWKRRQADCLIEDRVVQQICGGGSVHVLIDQS
ncbi:unnamed protein product [Pleuronectes platessa]|uniref:Uncharacterized protein n=1 Tax=Pleuronectes platessa TaxID=8262 RepID=A0A9N7Y5S0_PLEPL|nr:unnamed protein product [Pleuronectes platessa]